MSKRKSTLYSNPIFKERLTEEIERQVEKIRESLPSMLVRARTGMLERENEQLRKMIGK